MAEDRPTSAALTVPRCPWCSSEINPGAAMCATCGAALVEPDGSVPGVNAVDHNSISRAARAAAAPAQRSRLLSWLTGEYPEDESPAPPGSLAPPSADVRREMLRLQIEADYAHLQAEAQALEAEARAEAREHELRTPVAVAGDVDEQATDGETTEDQATEAHAQPTETQAQPSETHAQSTEVDWNVPAAQNGTDDSADR